MICTDRPWGAGAGQGLAAGTGVAVNTAAKLADRRHSATEAEELMSPTVGSKYRNALTGETVKVKLVDGFRIQYVGEEGNREWVEAPDFRAKFRETKPVNGVSQ